MRISAAVLAVIYSLLPLSSLGAEPEPAALKTATKAQYFSCLDAGELIEAKKLKLIERERLHKERASKFEAAEADLAAQVKRHAPSKKSEIESYNKAIAKRNASAERFNLESQSLQVEQRALNDLVFATNTRCGALLISEELAQAASERRKRMEPPR